MKNNPSKLNTKLMTSGENSGILLRSVNRINRVARVAGVGDEILSKRFHFLNERHASPLNPEMRDRQIVRQQFPQIKLPGDEFETADSKLTALKSGNDRVSQADPIILKSLPQASKADLSQPATSDRYSFSQSNRRLSAGRPIGIMLRNRLESLLRFNFSSVRTHTDINFAEPVKQSLADAITAGNHIFFAPGKYNPESRQGQALLVHELTHVRQQKSLKYPVSQHQVQDFEREALANESAVLNQPVNPYQNRSQPALNLSKPINPFMNVLNDRPNKNQTPPTTTPMAASVSRDLDLSATDSADANDSSPNITDFDVLYHSLKLKLQIEKERMGD